MVKILIDERGASTYEVAPNDNRAEYQVSDDTWAQYAAAKRALVEAHDRVSRDARKIAK